MIKGEDELLEDENLKVTVEVQHDEAMYGYAFAADAAVAVAVAVETQGGAARCSSSTVLMQ